MTTNSNNRFESEEHLAIAKSVLKPPLYDDLPAEIKVVRVNHLYNMCESNLREAQVFFKNYKLTIMENIDGRMHTMAFCRSTCIDGVTITSDTKVSMNIRHDCVDGWRIIIETEDIETRDQLFNALMIINNGPLMSYNLVPDNICEMIDPSKSKGLKNAQLVQMRTDATPAIPKGTPAEFKRKKVFDVDTNIVIMVVYNCQNSGRNSKCGLLEQLSVANGKIDCQFHTSGFDIEASKFLPPRLVTPPQSEKQILVCDPIDIMNSPQLAWGFRVDREHYRALRDLLMRAWMNKSLSSLIKESEEKLKAYVMENDEDDEDEEEEEEEEEEEQSKEEDKKKDPKKKTTGPNKKKGAQTKKVANKGAVKSGRTTKTVVTSKGIPKKKDSKKKAAASKKATAPIKVAKKVRFDEPEKKTVPKSANTTNKASNKAADTVKVAKNVKADKPEKKTIPKSANAKKGSTITGGRVTRSSNK